MRARSGTSTWRSGGPNGRFLGAALLASLTLGASVARAQPVDEEEVPAEPPDVEPPPDVEAEEPVDEPAPEPEPDPEPEVLGEGTDEGDTTVDANVDVEPEKAAEADENEKEPPPKEGGRFSLGSYGRVIAATDARGGPGRNADIVAYGSRLDESNYVELELRREDDWPQTGAKTALVATLAIGHPVFHYTGEFDANLAIRNLYFEERDMLVDGLRMWAGSRMLRGDDIYVLDVWPLDNLNTFGAGAGYNYEGTTEFQIHGGLSQPPSAFYSQTVVRPAPLDQFGSAEVEILNRQRFIGSARAHHIFKLGEGGAGIKAVLYGEMHQLPSGQRETDDRIFEDLPHDDGYVIGTEVSGFTGERSTHLNLYFRYATGLAAYGQWATPGQLALDKTTSGAREILVAAGGNYEVGPLGFLLGSYIRSFRDASPDLNYEDVDEGIVLLRPTVFFGEVAGVSLEGSYQVAQRGVLARSVDEEGRVVETEAPSGPLSGSLVRFGVVPFLSPGGRGSYNRPHFRFIYAATLRDDGARSLYPEDDVFRIRQTEHFVGFGAEWWFNSTSYSRQ